MRDLAHEVIDEVPNGRVTHEVISKGRLTRGLWALHPLWGDLALLSGGSVCVHDAESARVSIGNTLSHPRIELSRTHDMLGSVDPVYQVAGRRVADGRGLTGSLGHLIFIVGGEPPTIKD